MSNVIPFELPGRTMTSKERLQALMQATMNEERALLCSPEQPALREFLLINARLLRRLAGVQ